MYLELQGIDPRTSHMLSERSTIWATAPDDSLEYRIAEVTFPSARKRNCQILQNSIINILRTDDSWKHSNRQSYVLSTGSMM